MASLLSYLNPFKSSTVSSNKEDTSFTVAVAESITAGALSNALCSEPGASSYFKGGIVAYSIASKKEILNIDVQYAEQNNFANPSTTLEMAKQISKMFKARIGLATTGYSQPLYRPENKERGECELRIDNPYAYICLYDSVLDFNKVIKVDFTYDDAMSKRMQRATVQAKVALEGKCLYVEYADKYKDK